MNEKEFTYVLAEQLRASINDLEIEIGKSLFYSLCVDELGNIPLHLNQQGEPIRGGGTGFEQDILLFQRVSGQTSIVPRVAVEIKFNGITTHDAIVYSAKANRIRNVYPYLRYGLVMGNLTEIPARVLRLGLGFDFMVRISTPLILEEMVQMKELLSYEVEISRILGVVFSGSSKVSTFHRRLEITPCIDLSPLSKELVDKHTTILPHTFVGKPGINYFVYENWTAENKARIHYGYCRCCNHGKGIHPHKGDRNGCWHGPFNTFSDARAEAIATGRVVSECRKCAPE